MNVNNLIIILPSTQKYRHTTTFKKAHQRTAQAQMQPEAAFALVQFVLQGGVNVRPREESVKEIGAAPSTATASATRARCSAVAAAMCGSQLSILFLFS